MMNIRRIVEKKLAEAGHPLYKLTEALAKQAEGEDNPVVRLRENPSLGKILARLAEKKLAGFKQK
jgi:hypothetical protein